MNIFIIVSYFVGCTTLGYGGSWVLVEVYKKLWPTKSKPNSSYIAFEQYVTEYLFTKPGCACAPDEVLSQAKRENVPQIRAAFVRLADKGKIVKVGDKVKLVEGDAYHE